MSASSARSICVLHTGHGGKHLFVSTKSQVRLPGECAAVEPKRRGKAPASVAHKPLVCPACESGHHHGREAATFTEADYRCACPCHPKNDATVLLPYLRQPAKLPLCRI